MVSLSPNTTSYVPYQDVTCFEILNDIGRFQSAIVQEVVNYCARVPISLLRALIFFKKTLSSLSNIFYLAYVFA